jgi:hypothetical protein
MSKAAREVEIYASLAQPLTAWVATSGADQQLRAGGPGAHGAENGSLTFGIAPGGLFRLSASGHGWLPGLRDPFWRRGLPGWLPRGDLRWKLPGQRRACG